MPEAESQELIDNEVVEEVVTKEVEADPEISDETTTEEAATENEDFEVVLEGEEEPAPQTGKMPKRVKKLLERTASLQTDLDTQSQQNAREIERLKRELEASRQPAQSQSVINMPMPPREEDNDYDPEKIAVATAKYQRDMQSWVLGQHSSVTQKQAEQAAKNQRSLQEHKALEAHYDRVDKLKVSDYETNEAVAVDVLGKPLVKSIAASMSNSAMIINYLGLPRNKALAQELAQLDKSNNPDDIQKGVEKIWELNFKLKSIPRKKSNAPEPETRVEGGNASTSPLQKKADAAADNGDITLYRKIKAEARAKGITLN